MKYEDEYIELLYWVGATAIQKRYPHILHVYDSKGLTLAEYTIWSTKKKHDKYMWSEMPEVLFYSKAKIPERKGISYITEYWSDIISKLK